ncbi:MAG: hypothetical protein KF812_05485 [Fimbriimonadaceae bacterium]|nr:hypothetical protein [Fimbriimonadaceae bacterium]
MNYWVVAADGNKFGPADVSVLNTWIAEGRLNPDSELEVVETSERVRARDVAGLNFPAPTQPDPAQANPYAGQNSPSVAQDNPYANPSGGQNPAGQPGQVYNPYNNPYPRQMQYGGDDGSQDIKNSYMFSIIGFFCCGPAIIGGIITANKAIQKGNPGGNTARTVAIVMLSIWVLLFIVRIMLMVNGTV